MSENKKRLKMLFSCFLSVFALGFLAALTQSVETASSFALGFFGCAMICAGSLAYMAGQLRAQKTQLDSQIQDFAQEFSRQEVADNAHAQSSQSEQGSKNMDKISFSSKFIAGLKISLSGFRLLGYAIFIAMLILSLEIGVFEPFGLLLGVGVASLCIISTLAYVLFKK